MTIDKNPRSNNTRFNHKAGQGTIRIIWKNPNFRKNRSRHNFAWLLFALTSSLLNSTKFQNLCTQICGNVILQTTSSPKVIGYFRNVSNVSTIYKRQHLNSCFFQIELRKYSGFKYVFMIWIISLWYMDNLIWCILYRIILIYCSIFVFKVTFEFIWHFKVVIFRYKMQQIKQSVS